MAHPRRFRFGVQTQAATTGGEWAQIARRADHLGCSTLFTRRDANDLVVRHDAREPMAPVVAAVAGT